MWGNGKGGGGLLEGAHEAGAVADGGFGVVVAGVGGSGSGGHGVLLSKLPGLVVGGGFGGGVGGTLALAGVGVVLVVLAHLLLSRPTRRRHEHRPSVAHPSRLSLTPTPGSPAGCFAFWVRL